MYMYTIHIFVYACRYICICDDCSACIYTWYTYIYVYMCICIYIYVYMCICIYIYVCTCGAQDTSKVVHIRVSVYHTYIHVYHIYIHAIWMYAYIHIIYVYIYIHMYIYIYIVVWYNFSRFVHVCVRIHSARNRNCYIHVWKCHIHIYV